MGLEEPVLVFWQVGHVLVESSGDKAFSMTPTEAINTLYYDDMDILHIDNWRFFTPKKRDRQMIHP